MRLLLTGATGFVGRNLLLREMVENRYEEVWVPVRSVEKLKEQFLGDGFAGIPSKITPVVGSADDWKLSKAPKFHHVIHSAGDLREDLEEYRTVNVDGTLSLFSQIAAPERAIVLSSLSAAGPCTGSECRTEGDADVPITWYGRSKLEMEQKLKEQMPQLNYVCLRPPMIFGPRDQATLPLFKMVRRPLYFKAGVKTKHYSYISVFDLVSAIFLALEDKGDWRTLAQRYFFVASNDPVTDKDLITLTAQASNRKGLMLTVPQLFLKGASKVIDSIPTWRATIPSLSVDRAKEIWPDRWVVSSEAFQKRFGWVPREDLATVLKKTREWYVKTGQLVG